MLIGPALALVASLLWGAGDFAGGLLSRRFRETTVVAWSQGFGLVALALVLLVLRTAPPSGGWWLWGSAAAVFGTTGLALFYRALAIGTMGVVSPIAGLGSVLPVLLGVIGGDRPSAVQIGGIVLALAGAALASGPELSGKGASAKAVVLASLSGLGFGSAMFFMHMCAVSVGNSPGIGILAASVLAAAALRTTSVFAFSLTALVTRLVRGKAAVGVLPGPALAQVAGIGAVDTSANVAFAVSSTMGMLSLAAVLSSLYPVVTVIAARIVLKERLRAIQKAGVAVALIGVACVSGG